MSQLHKPIRRQFIFILLSIILLAGIGIGVHRNAAPVVIPTNRVGAVIKKVVFKKFVCHKPPFGFARKRSYLKMTVFAGHKGARPVWWGQYSAQLHCYNLYFVDKVGNAHYLSNSSGNAAYDGATQLYSRTCDIPISDGRIYTNRGWASGYTDHDWEKGGTLKCAILFGGGGWLHDQQGNLVRDSQSKAVRVGFSCDVPFTTKIKAE